MVKNHYGFVDILKGIAILLIVYGHIIPGAIPFMTEYVSTFHIPLFFFVSGLLYNDVKYKDNFMSFIANRIKTLMCPFFYFSAVVALGYIFVTDDFRSFLISLFINGWGGYALWFIPVLFLVELSYFPLSKMKDELKVMMLIMCAVLSFLSSLRIGLISNNAMLTFCGLWFYGLGNICRWFLKYSDELDYKWGVSLMAVGLLLSMLYIPFCNILPEWFVNKIPSPIFYITPLFAIQGLICLSLIIEMYATKFIITFLSICGKQSLIILAFHQIICMIAQKHVSSTLAILIMIATLTFLVLFIPKYMPWILGKN